MDERLPERIEGRGIAAFEVNIDGGPLERLFARLGLRVGTADCWFDVDGGRGPVRIECASADNRRLIARWLHAMRDAERYEAGRNRPITPAPKPVGKGKGHRRPSPS